MSLSSTTIVLTGAQKCDGKRELFSEVATLSVPNADWDIISAESPRAEKDDGAMTREGGS